MLVPAMMKLASVAVIAVVASCDVGAVDDELWLDTRDDDGGDGEASSLAGNKRVAIDPGCGA